MFYFIYKVLRWIVGISTIASLYFFLGVGCMGSFTFTTFSTFKLKNVQLRENKKHSILYPYLAYNYIGDILLAFADMTLKSIKKGRKLPL
jgi:fluoride exporter